MQIRYIRTTTTSMANVKMSFTQVQHLIVTEFQRQTLTSPRIMCSCTLPFTCPRVHRRRRRQRRRKSRRPNINPHLTSQSPKFPTQQPTPQITAQYNIIPVWPISSHPLLRSTQLLTVYILSTIVSIETKPPNQPKRIPYTKMFINIPKF